MNNEVTELILEKRNNIEKNNILLNEDQLIIKNKNIEDDVSSDESISDNDTEASYESNELVQNNDDIILDNSSEEFQKLIIKNRLKKKNEYSI
jgi:hypothetical protein